MVAIYLMLLLTQLGKYHRNIATGLLGAWALACVLRTSMLLHGDSRCVCDVLVSRRCAFHPSQLSTMGMDAHARTH